MRGDFFFFSSRRRHTRCLSDWSSDVCSSDLRVWSAHHIPPPKRNARKPWPKRLRRWVASIRHQVVESVYDKLFNAFGLWRERPHELSGLRARLAARVALHNFCMWLNQQLGRPRLAFADLLGW